MPHATQSVHTVGIVKQKGFTLIEISIVLTIIGLIVGGIVIGKSLIRQAQLQAVSGEVAKYTQAFIDFRDKYLALPGDFAGAEALWGSDTSCPNTPYTATPHTATCNGNGDGVIVGPGPQVGDFSMFYEEFRAWQQLADAGMIDGAYTGVQGPGGSIDTLVGTNDPASRLSGAGYSIYGANTSTVWSGGYFQAYYPHILFFGSYVYTATEGNGGIDGVILTPQEALSIDAKIDDGYPGSGRVMTLAWANCTTSNNASTARYNVAYSGIACPLLFLMPF